MIFTVVIRPEEDGSFMAYVPAISGCHAWGRSPEEAQAELASVFAMINEGEKASRNSIPFSNSNRSERISDESGIAASCKCPRCKRDCIFRWKEFKNGTRHIEQICPHHGYIKYVPKIQPYLEWASKANDNYIQKKLF